MTACPTCRRSGINADICPRCGTDLGQLNRIVALAEYFSRDGRRLLRQSRNAEAVAAFDAALALYDSPASRRGRAVALAGASRFTEALREIILSPGRV